MTTKVSLKEIQETIKVAKEELKKEGDKIPSGLKSTFLLLISFIEVLIFSGKLGSQNSSTPPSQDPNRKKNTSQKKGEKKKPGAQPKHKGTTLNLYEKPDRIESLKIDRRKLPKGLILTQLEPERRQVVDIELTKNVIEYQAETLQDQHGNIYIASFPDEAQTKIQYSPRVATYAVYLLVYQMVPYERAKELINETFGITISTGTLANMVKGAYTKLDPFEQKIRQELLEARVVHCDETGINIGGKNSWLHSVSHGRFALYHVDEKRGQEAMERMGFLPAFKGIVVHDHWKPYFAFENLTHALCHAHHLRELNWVTEHTEHEWAEEMHKLLIALSKEISANDYAVVSKERMMEIEKEYDLILEKGEWECPLPQRTPGQKGRLKKGKERCLLERFKDFKEENFLFLKDADVPFSNNMAEQDIRMLKVHQKISGCFKNIERAKFFCRIRSFLTTCRKQSLNVFSELELIMKGDPPSFFSENSSSQTNSQ